jgi:hypothetical protein
MKSVVERTFASSAWVESVLCVSQGGVCVKELDVVEPKDGPDVVLEEPELFAFDVCDAVVAAEFSCAE